MKQLFYLGAFLCSILITAQDNNISLGYNDLGVLFSGDDNNGTARSRAMSGAFGALGGDLSATEINPAGMAIFLKSEFSASLSVRNQTIKSNYYGTNTSLEDDFINLPQAGAVFVFESGNSKWMRTAVGFNYSISRDFNNNWIANGNSDFATFITDSNYTDDGDDTNDIFYLNTDGQEFQNYTSGKNNKYTFSIASQYSDDLYIGVSITSNDLSFYQATTLIEDNNDGNGNTNASESFLRNYLLTTGTGTSFTLGLISKPTNNMRLGLSYQSPTWYNLFEEYDDEFETSALDYTLRTPSKLTGSFAYVFDKNGLISLDYSLKNYSNIKLNSFVNFNDVNQVFDTDFKSSSELRVGTEWRHKKASFRGGYHFEQSPYKDALSSDDLKGYSFGLGYNFGNVKLDLSYENSNRTDVYDFYPQYSEVNAAELDFDTSKITATLVFNI
ncbi:MAG: outer membrane protein transport protein [Flavobacteriaceae bacterium]|nr:outer membrane protein transport protein [Flavobacteriaceae bacterium]